MKKSFLYCLLIIFSTGCLIGLSGCRNKTTGIVGNIVVINDGAGDRDAFRMILSANDDKTLLDSNYVVDVRGDNASLIVKCIGTHTHHPIYYQVVHKKGLEVVSVQEVNFRTYSRLIDYLHLMYNFHTGAPPCAVK